MKFSKIKLINLENIKKEKFSPGMYIILNRKKKRIYVGSSKRIKHRLEAILYSRSDYVHVNSKRILKKNAVYYQTSYMDIAKARKSEKNMKKDLKYNIL